MKLVGSTPLNPEIINLAHEVVKKGKFNNLTWNEKNAIAHFLRSDKPENIESIRSSLKHALKEEPKNYHILMHKVRDLAESWGIVPSEQRIKDLLPKQPKEIRPTKPQQVVVETLEPFTPHPLLQLLDLEYRALLKDSRDSMTDTQEEINTLKQNPSPELRDKIEEKLTHHVQLMINLRKTMSMIKLQEIEGYEPRITEINDFILNRIPFLKGFKEQLRSLPTERYTSLNIESELDIIEFLVDPEIDPAIKPQELEELNQELAEWERKQTEQPPQS